MPTPPVGMAWRFESESGEGVLFGTIHMGANVGWRWLAPPVREAFDRASVVIFEVDVRKSARMIGRAGKLPPGRRLRDLVAPATFSELQRVSGLATVTLDGFRPWYAYVRLLQATSPRGSSMDLFLLRQATGRQKRVAFLETPQEQFDTLDRAITVEILDDWMSRIDEVQQQQREMAAAYNRGDIAGVRDQVLPESGEPDAGDRILFTERNAKWLETIAPLIHPDHPVFIAVGAAHLVGPDNLLEGLEQRSFVVSQIHPLP